MADIHAVLLVPDEGDRHGLLRRGPMGARPPTCIAPFIPEPREIPGAGSESACDAWSCPGCCEIVGPIDDVFCTREDAIKKIVHRWFCSYRGLALGWDGEPVPEGCDRARRAGGQAPEMHYLCSWSVKVNNAAYLRAFYEGHFGKLGTVVLLDSDGREVAP